MRMRMKQAEEDRSKVAKLEKHNKLLEETIKSRNPNSLPMLIAATNKVTEDADASESKKRLQYRIKQLEGEIDEKDSDFERRIRALR